MIRESDHRSYRHTFVTFDQLFKALTITKLRHGHWIGSTIEYTISQDYVLI